MNSEIGLSPRESTDYLISEVKVQELFGRYSYRFSPLTPDEAQVGAPPLMLLYGRNGAGKTTVLNLIWHLFSAVPSKRHWTAISETPFRRLTVRLGDGTQIEVDKGEALIGDYSVVVRRKGRIKVQQAYRYIGKEYGAVPVDSDDSGERVGALARRLLEIQGDNPRSVGARQARRSIETDPDALSAFMEQLDATPILLGDDRRIHADGNDSAIRDRERMARAQRELEVGGVESVAFGVNSAVVRTTEWLRQQLLTGAAAGSMNANEIYREVLTQLGRTAELAGSEDVARLRERMKNLDERTRRFGEFGLATHFNSRPLLRILDEIPDERHSLVVSVLDPYLSGQDARLDSLEEVERLVRTFVDYLNEYFDDKTIVFTAARGMQIRSDDGSQIHPAKLSSGERQLLLLLCNTLLARSSTRLFMIDEPELSLNARWQRKLIRTLLDLASGSRIQFLMATHSIEIMTQHRAYLAPLEAVP